MLLSYISPVDITLKALNLNEFPTKNISSPFTEDKNPSFQVFKNGSFKCYSSDKSGDCFQLVADLNNLDSKKDFNKVLEVVATENNLLLQLGVETTKNLVKPTNNKINRTSVKVATQALQQFKFKSIEKINFEERHLSYWESYGVNIEVLNKYNVSAVKSYSFFSERKNQDCIFNFNTNEIVFCYDVNERSEIYIPKQVTKNKMFLNGLRQDDIFGLQQIKNKVENIIICAGKKDALVLNANNFYAVSFRSENQHLKKESIEMLQQKCNNLFICYDNDTAGMNATTKVIEQYPQITSLQLPNNINDVADFYTLKGKESLVNSFKKQINKNIVAKNDTKTKEKETTTIFHIVEDYLSENYDLRFNTISLEVEMTEKNKNEWEPCNENSLWLELQKKSIKVPLNSLIAILKSNVIERYNPIENYFKSLSKWDKKTDYIKTFTDYLILDKKEDREQLEYHFKKWCVRVIKCALIDGYVNKQAFILTDEGEGQNIGKSSWCRFLCPKELSNYIAEDIGNDKDSRILLAKNFLINLDELSVFSKRETNQLKAYISKDKINERLPYDRKNSIIQRVASFVGSTNMSTFLQDETGSVRWLCFVVKNIEWSYKECFEINNLWSQAYHLSLDENFDESLSYEDVKKNEERNDKFQVDTPEKDLLYIFFEIPTNENEAEFLTTTEIVNHISLNTSNGVKLHPTPLGKALKSLGYKRIKKNGVYGYAVKKTNACIN